MHRIACRDEVQSRSRVLLVTKHCVEIIEACAMFHEELDKFDAVVWFCFGLYCAHQSSLPVWISTVR